MSKNRMIRSSRVRERAKELELSQEELARRAGISRQRLVGLMAKDCTVREATLTGLARALEVSEANLEAQRERSDYLDWIRSGCGQVNFHGLGASHPQALAIDGIYVPLRVRSFRSEHCKENENELDERKDAIFLSSELARHPRLHIVGEPGSGKTTALRHAAWILGEQARGGGGDNLLPVWVSAAEWARARETTPGLELLGHVASQVRLGGLDPSGFLRNAIERGGAVIFIDGLDEVGDSGQRVDMEEAVKQLLEQHQLCRFVLSSRLVGFNARSWEKLRFAVCKVAPFSKKQIKHFLDKWVFCHHLHESIKFACAQCQRRSADLAGCVLNHARLQEIAGNPLILSLIAILCESTLHLPQRRGELYDRVLDVVLLQWESRKASSFSADLLGRIDLDGKEYVWILGDLALAMQESGRTLAPRWWVMEIFQRFLIHDLGFDVNRGKEQADELLAYVESRAGLLLDRGEGRFAFSHLTFQEHLAAKALIFRQSRMSPADAIAPQLFHPRWREVVRFLASSLEPEVTARLFRRLLSDASPLGRFLHRGPLLALECLVDGATIADRELLDELFNNVVELGRNRWLGLALHALASLAALEGTRLEERARTARRDLLAAAAKTLPEQDAECLRANDRGRPGLDDAKLDLTMPADKAITIVYSQSNGMEIDHFSLLLPELTDQNSVKAWRKRCQSQIKTENDQPTLVALLDVLSTLELQWPAIVKSIVNRMESDSNKKVRAACIRALAHSREWLLSNWRMLLDLARDKAQDDDVRSASTRALRSIAPMQEDALTALERILKSDKSVAVRVAAVHALGDCLATNHAVRDKLHQILVNAAGEGDHLASHAATELGTLESDLAVQSVLWQRVEDGDKAPLTATASAMALARAMLDRSGDWVDSRAAKLEAALMVANPSPGGLRMLRELCRAREERGGQRLESILISALAPLEHSIFAAFVFGSFASGMQGEDSDVDLFVVGDIGMLELASALRNAQSHLGREVNPVVYSPTDLTLRRRERDPFVLRVLEGKKIFLIGGANELESLA